MKKSDILFFLSALLFLTLFSILLSAKINSTEYLYNYDSWHHNYFTYFGESENYFTDKIEVSDGYIKAPYKSTLRSEIFILSLLTEIDIYSFFRYGSIFLRVIFAITLFITLNLFLKNKKLSLLSTIIIFSSYYFAWRSYLTFPENLAIIFHLISLWSLEKFRKTRSNEFLIILSVGLATIFYVHPKSLFYSIIIILAYSPSLFMQFKPYEKRKLLIPFVVFIILIIPISLEIFSILSTTIQDNVGDESSFGSTALGDERYRVPSPNDYLFYNGPLIIIFSIIGLITISKSNSKPIRLMLLLTLSLVLSLGPLFKIYVPIDRMQAYLFIPIIIFSSIFLKSIIKNNKSRKIVLFLIFLIVSLSVINLLNTEPWFALWRGELEMGNYLNSNYNSSKLYYFDNSLNVERIGFYHPSLITLNLSLANYVITKDPNSYKNGHILKEYDEYFLLKNE